LQLALLLLLLLHRSLEKEEGQGVIRVSRLLPGRERLYVSPLFPRLFSLSLIAALCS
jgi:hypothetical protein